MKANEIIKMNFRKIPTEKLVSFIGHEVHVRWANPKCHWVLRSINENMATLETTKTKRTLITPVTDLYCTRKSELLLDK